MPSTSTKASKSRVRVTKADSKSESETNARAASSKKSRAKSPAAAPPASIKPQPKAQPKPAFKAPLTPEQTLHKKLDGMPIHDVWALYRKSPSEEMRNWFMVRFLHLVRYNSERIYARLPDEVDIEDLMQAGLFGLMDAIDAFDMDRGVKFETYCAPRIRGAILDELRSMDWVPRLVRHRSAKVEQIRQQLEMQHGSTPTEGEISKRLGVDQEELKKILRDSSAVSISSLSRKCYSTDSSREVREIDVIEDDRQSDPLSEIQQRDLKDLLTKGLSRAERLIVILYYYEEMTMKEIGATLDLSESRVSQMHSSILARLKAQMQHREREFEPVA